MQLTKKSCTVRQEDAPDWITKKSCTVREEDRPSWTTNKSCTVMKRYGRNIKLLGLIAIMLLCLCVGPSYADQSPELLGDALVFTGRVYLEGITVTTDETNAVTMDVYDNTSAAAPKVIQTLVFKTSATETVASVGFGGSGKPMRTGIYVDVTCAGVVKYMVHYKRY